MRQAPDFGRAEAAIWTFTTAHVVFFLVVHADTPARPGVRCYGSLFPLTRISSEAIVSA